jgi:alpha-beta hydrolase superfamily lysophospholipase
MSNIIMKQYLIPTARGRINVLEGAEIAFPRSVVVVLHGFRSHHQFIVHSAGDLRSMSARWSAINMKTYGLEFRGHGRSEGPRGTFESIEDLVDDLAVLLRFVQNNHPDTPTFNVAESLGAAVAVHLAHTKAFEIAGLALISPLCELHASQRPTSRWAEAALLFLSKYPPFAYIRLPWSVDIVDPNLMDGRYIARSRAHPCAIESQPNIRTAGEMFLAGQRMSSLARDVNIPVLIFSGGLDTVIDADSIARFFEAFPSNSKKHIVLRDRTHSVISPHSGLDKTANVVLDYIDDWLDEHTKVQRKSSHGRRLNQSDVV